MLESLEKDVLKNFKEKQGEIKKTKPQTWETEIYNISNIKVY